MSINKVKDRGPKPKGVHRPLTVEEDKPFERFEDHEWYKFKFINYEIFKGAFGECVRLQFRCLNGLTQSGQKAFKMKISSLMSAQCMPSSKLYEFVTVLNGGKEPGIGEEVDLSAFYGTKVMGFVEDKKEKGKKTAEENCFQNVTKIKALKKSA